uniref:Heat shock protein, alpha-crystallin-related, b11 n=1 Tax=Neogobius melanostomus TaxID=47308 RepID=A0A8C6U9Y5_9GOBI
ALTERIFSSSFPIDISTCHPVSPLPCGTLNLIVGSPLPQEMRHNMEFMERLHQQIFEQIDQSVPRSSSLSTLRPVALENLSTDAEGAFAVSLDTTEFSPEELSVKQVGHKLRVSGKTEKRKDDGRGSYCYRCEEFRQELDLPRGVDPETVSCSLVGGRLQITERVVPITLTPGAAPALDKPQSEAETQESKQTHSSTKN